MKYDATDKKWQQFRRLLLGTVVENLIHLHIDVDIPSTRIDFDPESVFKVPRLDNYMRFKGRFLAPLATPPDEGALCELRTALSRSWEELLAAMSVIPLGDRLTSTNNEISIDLRPDRLELAFDLEAD